MRPTALVPFCLVWRRETKTSKSGGRRGRLCFKRRSEHTLPSVKYLCGRRSHRCSKRGLYSAAFSIDDRKRSPYPQMSGRLDTAEQDWRRVRDRKRGLKSLLSGRTLLAGGDRDDPSWTTD